jgi:PAS domain S-box-containing protein
MNNTPGTGASGLPAFSSVELFRTLFDESTDGIVVIDTSGRCVEVNARHSELSGYARHEVVGQTMAEMLAPEYAETILRRMAVLGFGEQFVFEHEAKRKDGARVSLEIIARRVSTDHIVLIVRDIGARKRAESQREVALQALQASENRFSKVFRSSPAAMSIARLEDGCFIEANDSFLNLIGYSRDEVIGRRAGEDLRLYADPGGRVRVVQRLREWGAVVDEELRIVTRAGDERVLLMSADLIELDGAACILTTSVDITERQRAETQRENARHALRESEARLELALAASQLGAWEWDLRSGAVYWSEACCAIFGVETLAPEPGAYRELVHPADVEQAALTARRVTANREHYAAEFRVFGPDGKVRWVSLVGKTRSDAAGNPIQVFGTLQDITERKQAEVSLREHARLQDRFAAITACVPGVIVTLRLSPDGSTCIPYASAGLADLCGLRPEDVLNDAAPAFARIRLADVGRLYTTLMASARALTPLHAEWRMRHPLKGEVWVEANATPQREPDGGTLWHGYVHDVTERKRIEKALGESEARFRSYVQHAPLAVFVIDQAGNVVESNPAAVELLKADAVAMKGWPFMHMHPESARDFAQSGFATLRREGRLETEFCLDNPGGEPVWVALHAAVLPNGNYLIYLQDISDRRWAEEASRESERRLNEAQRIAHIGSWELDVETNTNLWSEGMSLLLERDPQLPALTYSEFMKCVHPEDRSRVERESAATGPGQRLDTEYRVVLPGGQVKWLHDRSEVIGHTAGSSSVARGIMQDVTERKQAEEKLQASERRLKLFIEHAPAAIAMFDCDMKYLAASRRFLSDYRLTEQDVVGRSHYDIFPEIPQRWKDIHQRCLAGAVEKAEEDPFPRADGGTDWVRWEIMPWYEKPGQIGGIMLFSEVITEHVQAVQALRESERRWAATLTSVGDNLPPSSACCPML